MSLRVVVDTNVLFSAIGWGGKPGDCVDLVRAGRIRGLTCVEILEELADKLATKLRFKDNKIDVILGSLLAFFEVIPIAGTMTGLQPDPKDDKILECAAAGHATHIVTGDRQHLLPLRKFNQIEIVSPAKLIQIALQNPISEP